MDEREPKWRLSRRQRNAARTLRANLTDAERRLWNRLRAHRLEGLSFRRQAPVGPFIVDFLSHEARLVIEVDGGQHFEGAGRERDAGRDAFLTDAGLRVLRFSNLDVLTNLDGVLLAVLDAAGRAFPPPNPPPQAGEG